MWCFNIVLIILCQAYFAFGQNVYFGALVNDPMEEEAFKFAVNWANLFYGPLNFIPLIDSDYNGVATNPLQAKVSACNLIAQQALVIFGPKHPEEIEIVQSICDHKDMAHVINRWIFDSDDRGVINFYPDSSYLTTAYFSVLEISGWKSFTLLYEDDESLLRLGDVVDLAKNAGIIVVAKRLSEDGDNNYRPTLKEVAHSGETNFLIDCKIEILENVLTQAQQVGLMTSHYNFFITNMDLRTIDLESFRYSEANITGIRIFNPSDEFERAANKFNFSLSNIKTETALLIDSVLHLAKTISTKLSFRELEPANISCDSQKTSNHGYTIANHVKTSKNVLLTGLIEFDVNGFRNNINLDIIELKEQGIIHVGTWNATYGLKMYRPTLRDIEDDPGSLRNKTFKVITCLTDPYTMLKETSVQLFGNDRFEGFAIDLIHELSVMEGFNYTFIIREDKANGAKDPKTGEWSGMIGDVMDGTADLAITDLTITAEREEAVDFTSPFMNLGISILAQKPGNAPPSFFSFADPFALDTWIMLALAYVAVSLSFFVMGRLCQDEWTNPYPCIEEPEYLINQFSLQNSAWFAVGALMQQGTEIAPIAFSTRMVTGMWWFFVLIMVSSYTANLAAFLATENPIHLFTDVHSLVANQEKHGIKMGAKDKGATESFFKDKEESPFKEIAKYMETHREDMVKDNKEGVERAGTDTYAFFMESTSIEYETQRRCELQQYGKLLDDKGYGIAMRKNSTYRKRLSTAILKLQASGELDKLKRKWWEEKKGGGQCNAANDDEQTPPLSVQNVQGVFYVTVGGTILAVFLVIPQMLVATYKMSKKTRIPFKEALATEMRSFIDFNSDVKPAMKEQSQSGSKSSKESGSGMSNNNLTANPAPYGFIPTITKEELQD